MSIIIILFIKNNFMFGNDNLVDNYYNFINIKRIEIFIKYYD